VYTPALTKSWNKKRSSCHFGGLKLMGRCGAKTINQKALGRMVVIVSLVD
jgi:hypothetical protein